MAIIKVSKPINVEDIYVQVTCPECSKSVNLRMKGPSTRKNCPKCNRLTYVFNIEPIRGAIIITATTIGVDNSPTEYVISPSDVEII